MHFKSRLPKVKVSDRTVSTVQAIVLLLILLAGPLQPLLAQTQLKIGFVNAAKILDQSPQAEQARKRLEKEFAPRDKALVDAQRALRSMEDKLVKDGAVMSDAERRRLEREIRDQRRELKRAQDEFREDFNLRRNEELGKLQRLVYEAIVSLAELEGFDLIVNDGAVIFASKQVDITDKVIGRLK
jgi:outer membrane protein